MMPGRPGHYIVDRALVYASAHPMAPALEVLDVAMRGEYDTHIDFECEPQPWGDWLDPPSPFAELLHRAFGLHLPDGTFDAESPDWQLVIDAYAARYRLWC